jgi:DNA-binding response OmpR family regulator
MRSKAKAKARLLLVDDDDMIRSSLSVSMTRAGFAVTTADDGCPAIALAAGEPPPPFELLLVDFNMRTRGDAVVRHYKQLFGARVYCAILSGADDPATRAACLAAGADDVFVKPASPIELRTALAAAASRVAGAMSGEVTEDPATR